LLINSNRALLRMSLDKVPTDAVISKALLRYYTQRDYAGTPTFRVYPNVAAWTSSVTWAKRPAIGALLASVTLTVNPIAGTLVETDVTSWAITRSRNGLMVDTSSATNAWIKGSAYSDQRPVLYVEYSVVPDTPSNQAPNGGAVSVASPVLTYTGESDMTQQRIEYSLNGALPSSFDTGWLAATSGLFDPATVAGSPALAVGASIWWRATTNGPNGQSVPSPWVQYSYQPLPVITILNPPDQTDDGSPTLQWSVAPAGAQAAWQATYNGDNGTADHSNWQDDADTDWTPSKGVKVPGGVGNFALRIHDNFVRVAAVNAPTFASAAKQYTTSLAGSGTAVDSLEVSFDDPIPMISGTRLAGMPDYIGLFRDNVQVPLWDPVDGTPYMWAPAVNFFTAPDFTLPDLTADLKHDHVWSVRTKTAGVTSSGGPTATGGFYTDSVWLVDPRTGDTVEVFGYNQIPVVEQVTDEGSIVHTPIHGDLVVEPVRRRLWRTTVRGSINGLVCGADDELLEQWVLGDSGVKYRLIFGRTNWSVILGDYSPTEMFYPEHWGVDRVLILINWWQRLRDY
jgi:hypothetical protein